MWIIVRCFPLPVRGWHDGLGWRVCGSSLICVRSPSEMRSASTSMAPASTCRWRRRRKRGADASAWPARRQPTRWQYLPTTHATTRAAVRVAECGVNRVPLRCLQAVDLVWLVVQSEPGFRLHRNHYPCRADGGRTKAAALDHCRVRALGCGRCVGAAINGGATCVVLSSQPCSSL
jgi:hypothetical protein